MKASYSTLTGLVKRIWAKTLCIAIGITLTIQALPQSGVLNSDILFRLMAVEEYYCGGVYGAAVIKPTATLNGTPVSTECFAWESFGCSNGGWTNHIMVDQVVPYDSYLTMPVAGYRASSSDYCNGQGDLQYQGNAIFSNGQDFVFVAGAGLGQPCVWDAHYGSGGNQTIWQDSNSPMWAFGVQGNWRYLHGTSFGDPLDLGTLSAGQTAQNSNSNRPAPTSPNVGYGYVDNGYQSNAPDVHYRFAVDAFSTVTISVDPDATLDPHLALTDDAGNGIMWLTSGIPDGTVSFTADVCPGVYHVIVDGNQGSAGNFNLSMAVNAASSSVYAQCQNIEVHLLADQTFSGLDLVAGSVLDCGVAATSVSPENVVLGPENAGVNSIPMTIYGNNGAIGTCTATITVIDVTGIDESMLEQHVTLSPNPSSGVVKLDIDGQDLRASATVAVFNLLGEQMLLRRAIEGIQVMDLGDLAKGFYVVQVRNGDDVVAKRVTLE